MNDLEEWKDIIGYEGIYEISNQGRILSKKNNHKILKCTVRKGYVFVILRKENTSKQFRVHRLVAENFIDNPEKKEQVNHINGIKHDNRLCNLEWNTSFENMQHAYKNGLLNIKKGKDHYCYKLTEQIKNQIGNLHKNHTQKSLAEMFNVSQSCVSKFLKQKNNTDFINV